MISTVYKLLQEHSFIERHEESLAINSSLMERHLFDDIYCYFYVPFPYHWNEKEEDEIMFGIYSKDFINILNCMIESKNINIHDYIQDKYVSYDIEDFTPITETSLGIEENDDKLIVFNGGVEMKFKDFLKFLNSLNSSKKLFQAIYDINLNDDIGKTDFSWMIPVEYESCLFLFLANKVGMNIQQINNYLYLKHMMEQQELFWRLKKSIDKSLIREFSDCFSSFNSSSC